MTPVPLGGESWKLVERQSDSHSWSETNFDSRKQNKFRDVIRLTNFDSKSVKRMPFRNSFYFLEPKFVSLQECYSIVSFWRHFVHQLNSSSQSSSCPPGHLFFFVYLLTPTFQWHHLFIGPSLTWFSPPQLKKAERSNVVLFVDMFLGLSPNLTNSHDLES